LLIEEFVRRTFVIAVVRKPDAQIRFELRESISNAVIVIPARWHR